MKSTYSFLLKAELSTDTEYWSSWWAGTSLEILQTQQYCLTICTRSLIEQVYFWGVVVQFDWRSPIIILSFTFNDFLPQLLLAPLADECQHKTRTDTNQYWCQTYNDCINGSLSCFRTIRIISVDSSITSYINIRILENNFIFLLLQ